MSTAICTLFEGHYHKGAAALINSLHAAGFRGRFVCGLRGPLPPWAEPSHPGPGDTRIRDLDGIEIWFVPQTTTIHFTNFKPRFLLETWQGPAGDPSNYYYLDPDIVVKSPWPALERWGWEGIALCEDVNNYLPPRHPLRLGWMQWLAQYNLPIAAPQRDRYYSGGFIGVPAARREILSLWADLIDKVGATNGTLANIKEGGPTALFHTPDQDAMNIALMLTDAPINAIGPEGMDFTVGGHYLSHAIGTPKPWQGGFVRRALKGFTPSPAAKSFFNYVHSPIQVFTESELASHRRSLALAALLGRFYRRA